MTLALFDHALPVKLQEYQTLNCIRLIHWCAYWDIYLKLFNTTPRQAPTPPNPACSSSSKMLLGNLWTCIIQTQLIRIIPQDHLIRYQTVSNWLWHLRRVIFSFDFLPASALCNSTVDLKQQMHLLRALNGMLFLFSHESKGKWYQFIKYAAKQTHSHSHTCTRRAHSSTLITELWLGHYITFHLKHPHLCLLILSWKAQRFFFVERQLGLKQWTRADRGGYL